MRVIFLRHGRTAGNLEKRYVGRRSDEPLLADERRRLSGLRRLYETGAANSCAGSEDAGNMGSEAAEKQTGNTGADAGTEKMEEYFGNGWADLGLISEQISEQARAVWVSPLRRCTETAELLFPGVPQIVVPGLAECDFGKFEYRNYPELNGDSDYQRFLDSGGTEGFPGGEQIAAFKRRCAAAFRKVVEEEKKAEEMNHVENMEYVENMEHRKDMGNIKNMGNIKDMGNIKNMVHMENIRKVRPEGSVLPFVVHGGTIMAVMEAFAKPKQSYYAWQVKNGCGVMAEVSWGADGCLRLLRPVKLAVGDCTVGASVVR